MVPSYCTSIRKPVTTRGCFSTRCSVPNALQARLSGATDAGPPRRPIIKRCTTCCFDTRATPKVKPRFTQHYEPLAPSTLATWGTKKQLALYDKTGRRRCSSSTAEASPGVPLGDVWDIGIVAPVARERTGYPTQKPEALLSRLVETLTLPGDWVLDPYVGSGTTLAVCARLSRNAIGIDDNPAAIDVTCRRLLDLGIAARKSLLVAGPALRSAQRGPISTSAARVA